MLGFKLVSLCLLAILGFLIVINAQWHDDNRVCFSMVGAGTLLNVLVFTAILLEPSLASDRIPMSIHLLTNASIFALAFVCLNKAIKKQKVEGNVAKDIWMVFLKETKEIYAKKS